MNPATTRPFIITLVACSLFLGYSYFTYPNLNFSMALQTSSAQSPVTPFAKWHARAHHSPGTFTPTLSALSSVVIHSAQADPEGFTVAFFKPNIAVDARGEVVEVAKEDFEGIEQLARRTVDGNLPKSDIFLNLWRIKQLRTEQPIERLYVPKYPSVTYSDAGSPLQLEVTSVQGFNGIERELKEPVGGYDILPNVLWDLFGLVLEARDGYVRGEENKQVIEGVKAVLHDAYVIENGVRLYPIREVHADS